MPLRALGAVNGPATAGSVVAASQRPQQPSGCPCGLWALSTVPQQPDQSLQRLRGPSSRLDAPAGSRRCQRPRGYTHLGDVNGVERLNAVPNPVDTNSAIHPARRATPATDGLRNTPREPVHQVNLSAATVWRVSSGTRPPCRCHIVERFKR